MRFHCACACVSCQSVGPRSVDEIKEACEGLIEREKRMDKDWLYDIPAFPVERACLVDTVTPGTRPPYVPAFLPAFPEPFTYKATASDAGVRDQGAASVKRHHTQLVREVSIVLGLTLLGGLLVGTDWLCVYVCVFWG